VELVRRYCNRRDLQERLAQARSRVSQRGGRDDDRPDVAWGRIPGAQRSRLTDADVQCLIGEFQAGAPKWALAETYAVSLSTVKNILRKHGVSRANSR
jgi:hypothetical protein